MAQMHRAIPLDSNSQQSGDTNWKALTDTQQDVIFSVKFTTPGHNPTFIFITLKNGVETKFPYAASVNGNSILVTLTSQNMATIYNAANNGDWDYVKCTIDASAFNNGGTSELEFAQGGVVYNSTDWPPV